MAVGQTMLSLDDIIAPAAMSLTDCHTTHTTAERDEAAEAANIAKAIDTAAVAKAQATLAREISLKSSVVIDV